MAIPRLNSDAITRRAADAARGHGNVNRFSAFVIQSLWSPTKTKAFASRAGDEALVVSGPLADAGHGASGYPQDLVLVLTEGNASSGLAQGMSQYFGSPAMEGSVTEPQVERTVRPRSRPVDPHELSRSWYYSPRPTY